MSWPNQFITWHDVNLIVFDNYVNIACCHVNNYAFLCYLLVFFCEEGMWPNMSHAHPSLSKRTQLTINRGRSQGLTVRQHFL